MKKIICFLCILLLSGCVNNHDEKVLNVLNWSSYIPDDVIIDFEKETGINVNYSTYSSNEELLAKVSSAKNGTYDLVFPSDYMVEIMIKRGMLEEIDLKLLNNYNNLNVNYTSLSYDIGNKYSVPFIAATSVLSVNREYIKDEINSYNDLLNPKFKNQIVMIDDQRIVIGMALLANGFDMNSTDEEELKIAKDWLLKLKNNLKAYDSDSPKNFLITEEAYIGFLWNAEAALANNENKKIDSIFPEEGVAVSIDNFVILKGAKHLDETYKFIDYILRPDIMKRIVESYPYKNLNRETEKLLDDEYMNNNAANISDEIIKNAFFVKNIGEDIKLYDEIWAEIK